MDTERRRTSRKHTRRWFFFSAAETRRSGGEKLYRQVITDNFVNHTVPANSSDYTTIVEVASHSSRQVPIVNLASSLKERALPRGRTFHGSPGVCFDRVAEQHGSRWWISSAGLHIGRLEEKASALNEFNQVAGKLMSEAKLGATGRLLPAEYTRIANALDKAKFPLRRELEAKGRKILAEWNQQCPQRAIRTFEAAIQAHEPRNLNRAVKRRLYRAKNAWKKYTRPTE
jgi:hypothetical protein